LHDFHKICRVCTQFQDALAVKISLDLLKFLRYGGFTLTAIDCFDDDDVKADRSVNVKFIKAY